MKALKVLLAVLVLLVQVTSIGGPALASNVSSQPGEKVQLLVTAYYSPLPDQTFYIKGSFEADVRLNGRGTNGADGTEVYIGMLAAPKTYPFGTRVKIPGLGVGEVHDRGGAILARKNYDRIDVWMGHGEEGLARALNWGSRLVEGEVYKQAHQIEPGLDYSWISSELPASYVEKLRQKTLANSGAAQATPAPAPAATPAPVVAEAKKQETPVPTQEAQSAKELVSVVAPVEQEISPEEAREVKRLEQNRLLLAAGIGKNAEGEDVLNLQRMLWDLGYYNGELTATYDELTVDAVYRFQKDHGVVNGEYDLGAGYFGQKTLAAMMGALERKIDVITSYPKTAQTWVPAKKVLPQIASLEAPKVKVEKQGLFFATELFGKDEIKEVVLTSELDLNDQNESVVALQNILIKQGHLAEGLNTGYYGLKTTDAVLAFQLKNGVISDPLAPGAGRVGPKTLEALNSLR